ncbi:LysR family transcriptional regulator [Rothia nasimurium]|uniref:LysR family transcriptional regulator n=1 Tax=Luteibacter anthropi TaxID=564369 RepID=A0A7X5ZIJ1_9GAMM|nr:LysR family transcriptional regulator [Luteibacter anthropi]NII06922.1 LysR family transcriptional regulator [Luteibacter anthropi]
MSFDGRLLSGVAVLTAVVESGSFRRAAAVLGMSDSGVGRAVARLETRVGIRLLDRTTRSLALTEEGRRFYERVVPGLADIEEAAEELLSSTASVRGKLRVDVDPFFLRTKLADGLPGFLGTYPEVELDLLTRQSVSDLVIDGIDVALRFGEPPVSSSYASRQLLDTRVLTVASPGYLERHGHPVHPAELAHHACIHFRNPTTDRAFPWEFHSKGEILTIPTSTRLMVSDVTAMLRACAGGAGIAQTIEVGTEDLIEAGQLVVLFPEWPDERFSLYAIYPSQYDPSARVRAFLEFVLKAINPSSERY